MGSIGIPFAGKMLFKMTVHGIVAYAEHVEIGKNGTVKIATNVAMVQLLLVSIANQKTLIVI